MSQQLEDRFYAFAEAVRDWCRLLKWNIINAEYIKQLIRASSSIGANYIEASDSLGLADEKMKLKISRRETKESMYWLKLILIHDNLLLAEQRLTLLNEAEQIKKILSAIINKL